MTLYVRGSMFQKQQDKIDELSALCEKQQMTIEHLFIALETIIQALNEAYLEAQSVSTQTGTSEK